MMRDLVAGIDCSTQSCTVLLRRLDNGAVLAEARAPHPHTTPPVSEQEPQAWWDALEACLSQLHEHLSRIAAISVGGQGHGLVLLDAKDHALRPAKLWNDTESAPDAEHLLTIKSAEEWVHRTGSIPAPALTISKLAWTERNFPGLVARARRVMLPFDYIIYRLSGNCVTERGGSSGTGYFNPFDNCWDLELANLAVPLATWQSMLPDIVASDARAGSVRASTNFGELEGAMVGVGTGDNMSAALGLCLREGDTVISIGTSGTVYGRTSIGVCDASGAINGYADAAGGFLPMVTTLNAAKVTDAIRRLLDLRVDAFDELVLSAPAGSDGLTLVPYFDGERCPNLPGATGTLHGLRSAMTRAGLARAAVEGVLCGLLEGADLLTSHGVMQSGRLILVGGGARSRAYRQVLADLTGRTVWICTEAEVAAAGAAVQAAAALSGTPILEIAAAWASSLEVGAQPQRAALAASGEVRQAYRHAAQEAFEPFRPHKPSRSAPHFSAPTFALSQEHGPGFLR